MTESLPETCGNCRYFWRRVGGVGLCCVDNTEDRRVDKDRPWCYRGVRKQTPAEEPEK